MLMKCIDFEYFIYFFHKKVCGANRSIVIQTTTEEEMHLWLNNILAHKVMVEAVIDSIEIDLW